MTGRGVSAPASKTVKITDDDATVVTLSGGGTVTEANTAATVEVTVSLGRALATEEMVEVPLSVAGVAAGDFTLAKKTGAGVNTGVTLTGANTLAPRVRLANAGAQTAVLLFAAVDDSADEGASETATITLGNLSANTLATNVGGGAEASDDGDPNTPDNTVTVVITDDDDPAVTPVAQFGSATYTAGEASGSRTASVVVNLSPAPSGSVSVSYTVTGTAAAPGDYAALSGTVSVGTSGTATIAVTVADDSIDEVAETVVLTLAAGSGYSLGSTRVATVTISDNDAVPVVSLVVASSVSESGAAVPVTAALSHASDTAVVVTVSSSGSAASLSNNKTLTIAAGQVTSSGVVTLDPAGDTADTADRQVTVSATVTGRGVAAPASKTVKITDDDATVVTLSGGGTVTEANTAATVEVTVSLARALAAGETVEVPLAVAGVSTGDFTLSEKTGAGVNTGVTLAAAGSLAPRVRLANAGAQTAVLLVAAVDDSADEGASETATITLGNLSANTLGTNVGGGAEASDDGDPNTPDNTVTVVITDDDDPPPLTPVAQFASASYTAGEASGSRAASVVVNLSPAPSGTVSVSYTVGGTAVAPGDYAALSGTVSVGTSGTATIAIAVAGDSIDEVDETVELTLTAGSGYSLGSVNVATVTITDDDPTMVTLSGGGTVTEANTAATVEITVSLGRALVAGETVEVPLSVLGVSTADFTLTRKVGTGVNTGVTLVGETTLNPKVVFAGTGAQVAVLVLAAVQDSDDEGVSETASVTLGDLADATLDTNVNGSVEASDDGDPNTPDNTAEIVITDDDTDDDSPPVNTPIVPPVVDSQPVQFAVPVVGVEGGVGVVEGGVVRFVLRAVPAPVGDVLVGVRVLDPSGFVSGRAVAGSVVVGESGVAVVAVPTVDDSVAQGDGLVSLVVLEGGGYRVDPGGVLASVGVEDDDGPAAVGGLVVTWSVVDGVMSEGSVGETAEVEVRLSRGLADGESLDVDLDVAHVGSVWSLSLVGSPEGVSFDGRRGRLSFEGPGAARVVRVSVAAAGGVVDGSAVGASSWPFGVAAVSGVAGASGYVGGAYGRRLVVVDGANAGPVLSLWAGSGGAARVPEGGEAVLVFGLSEAREQDTVVRFEVVGWGGFPVGAGDLGEVSGPTARRGGEGGGEAVGEGVGVGVFEVVIPAGSEHAVAAVPVADDGAGDGDKLFAVRVVSMSAGVRAGAASQLLFVAADGAAGRGAPEPYRAVSGGGPVAAVEHADCAADGGAEAVSTASYTVRLDRRPGPGERVMVSAHAPDDIGPALAREIAAAAGYWPVDPRAHSNRVRTAAAASSPQRLWFTESDWDTPQTVAVEIACADHDPDAPLPIWHTAQTVANTPAPHRRILVEHPQLGWITTPHQTGHPPTHHPVHITITDADDPTPASAAGEDAESDESGPDAPDNAAESVAADDGDTGTGDTGEVAETVTPADGTGEVAETVTPADGTGQEEGASSQVPVVGVEGGVGVVEGGVVRFVLRAVPAPVGDVLVGVRVLDPSGFVSGRAVAGSVVVGESGVAVVAVPTVDDSVAQGDGLVSLVVLEGGGYRVDPGGVLASVGVEDDDGPAAVGGLVVTWSVVDGVMSEGSVGETAEVEVRLSRGLVDGESLDVDLDVAHVGSVWSLSLVGSPEGVSFDGRRGRLSFEGPGAARVVRVSVAAAGGVVDGSAVGASSWPFGVAAVSGVAGASGYVGGAYGRRLVVVDGANAGPVLSLWAGSGGAARVPEGGEAVLVFGLSEAREQDTVVRFEVVGWGGFPVGAGDLGEVSGPTARRVGEAGGEGVGEGVGVGVFEVVIPAGSEHAVAAVPVADDGAGDGDKLFAVRVVSMSAGVRAGAASQLLFVAADGAAGRGAPEPYRAVSGGGPVAAVEHADCAADGGAEAVSTASYTVRLDRRPGPGERVMVSAHAPDDIGPALAREIAAAAGYWPVDPRAHSNRVRTAAAASSPQRLWFTESDWDTPQTVAVEIACADHDPDAPLPIWHTAQTVANTPAPHRRILVEHPQLGWITTPHQTGHPPTHHPVHITITDSTP